MKSILLTSLWFPVLLLIVQTLLISFVSSLALRWMGLLRKPFNGMEYAQIMYAGTLMLGMIVIAAADSESLFQSAKVYLDSHLHPLKAIFSQFSELFLIVLLTGIIFLAMNYACYKWITKRQPDELEIPSAILLTAIALGTIFTGWIVAKEYSSLLTPKLLGLSS